MAAAWTKPLSQGADTGTRGASPRGNPHPPHAPFNPVPTTPPPGMTSPTLSSQPPGGSSGVQNPPAGDVGAASPLPGPPAPRGGRVPGARSSARQSPWGWGLSLASPGGLEGEARAAEGWGKAGVMEERSPFKGETRPGRRSRETALSRGSPGDGGWRGKALQSSQAGRRCGSSSLAPTWSRPSRAGLHSGAPAHPHPQPPAQRPLPSGPARGPSPVLRGPAPPPHTHVPLRPQPRVMQPAALGSFQRRAPGESSPAPSPAAAKPPAPPAEPSRRPRPVRPSGALFGRSWPGAATGHAAGCSGASSEHNGRAGFPSTKPARCPLRCLRDPHWSAGNFRVIRDLCPPLYLEAGWAGLPRLCPASHPGCYKGSERSPSASGSRHARAGRAAGRAARGHSLRLALPSRRLPRPRSSR